MTCRLLTGCSLHSSGETVHVPSALNEPSDPILTLPPSIRIKSLPQDRIFPFNLVRRNCDYEISIKRDSSSPLKPLRFQISLNLSELSNFQSIINPQAFSDSVFDSSLARCSGKKYFFSQNSASIIHAFILIFSTSVLVFL